MCIGCTVIVIIFESVHSLTGIIYSVRLLLIFSIDLFFNGQIILLSRIQSDTGGSQPHNGSGNGYRGIGGHSDIKSLHERRARLYSLTELHYFVCYLPRKERSAHTFDNRQQSFHSVGYLRQFLNGKGNKLTALLE